MNQAGIVPPLQTRSRASWGRILDSAIVLLREHGFAGFTITALCEMASVSPSTLYSRARSKEQLLLAVYDHAAALRSVARLDPDDGRWDALSLDETTEQATRRYIDALLQDAALVRAIEQMAAVYPEVLHRYSRTLQDDATAYRRVLQRAGASPPLADVCFRILYSALRQRIVHGQTFESDLPLTDSDLRDALIYVARLTVNDGIATV